ncbi:MAG: pseudouridine-5'-phosphate glycosidase [Actinomycetes bacterium]|jgi:pseudouridine-5'-phosphate glycosidase
MIHYSKEVAAALSAKKPIVALESTIISHGLPRPRNLTVAQEVEDIVRVTGAVPATIAILNGEIHVGLEADELERIANENGIVKASTRDLAVLAATKRSAATTVAATAHIAAMAGISVFATGGLGGVHRGDGFDESADLRGLSITPIILICAGVKSILNVEATLERLETLAVPVLGYKTNKFPGFYLTDSGFKIEHRVDTPGEVASIWNQRKNVNTSDSAIIVTNPVDIELNPILHDQLLRDGLAAANANHISGKAVTPFLLEFFHRVSDGKSLDVNVEIIKSNSKLAAEIALAL